MKVTKPNLVIFHANCYDGFAAAQVVHDRWPSIELVNFYGATYGEKHIPDVTGKVVLMVDFSYKRPIMEEMAKKAKSIQVIDHHETAAAELAQFSVGSKYPNVEVVFDMDHSGCVLTWMHLYQGAIIPKFLAHVEDRDLWRFRMPNTREVISCLGTYPFSFEVWEHLEIVDLIEGGKHTIRQHLFNISKFIKEQTVMRIGNFDVPSVNVPYHYASELANELLYMHPDAPFAAAWFQRADGLFQFSLRSEDQRQSASEVAKLYGGGGHRNAAGFQVPSLVEFIDKTPDLPHDS